MEVRATVAGHHDLSGSSAETAEMFGCGESCVRRLIQRRCESGTLEVRSRRRPDTRKLGNENLAGLIRDRPDLMLGELAETLGRKLSVPTIRLATRRLGLRRKKRTLRAAEQDRPDMRERRREWHGLLADVRLD